MKETSSDRYAVRRALLKALFRFSCPQDLNTLMNDDRVIALDADPARLRSEWGELHMAGYVQQVQGWPDYFRLAPAARAKLERGWSMADDPFLAGPLAVE